MTVSIPCARESSALRPDIVLTCDELDLRAADKRESTMSSPKLIVEVLSASTADADRGRKFRNYFLIPTLEEYLLVDSASKSVTLHRRVDAQIVTSWPEPVIELASIRCEISLDRLYEGRAVAPAGS